MADNALQEAGRKESADKEVSQLRKRPNVGKTSRKSVAQPTPVNWQVMTLLLMQMQEHMEILSRQDAEIDPASRKAVAGLAHCADELLPTLLAEARRQGGE